MKYDMDTWARQVKNEHEIPESFTTFFESLHYHLEQFPYTIFAPPEKWYRRKSTPKMLVLLEDRLYIAEKIKKQIQTTCFLFQDINYIETGRLLLHSWFEINGIVDGKITTITIEYNTVVERLFKSIIEKIRSTMYHLDDSDLAKEQLKMEQAKFDVLMKTNFKYMNFGKYSLLAGEKIRQFILQPDIQVKFLKYFQRLYSYTHLTILTDCELIIVKDDDSFQMAQQVRYGGIWRYIPLRKIMKMTIEAIYEHNLAKLTLLLPEGVSLSFLFLTSRQPDLELLLQMIEQPDFMQKECV